MLPVLSWVAALALAVTSTSLLLSRDWRWSLSLLAGQYLAMFWLIYAHWPLTMSAAKLVTGWMAIAILGMTQLGRKTGDETSSSWPGGRLFRLFAAGLVLVTATQASQSINNWLPDPGLPVLWGGVVLIGSGLLHLGITAHPFRVTIGLLTTLAGFEILYAAVENSLLVAGLLALINLGLALVGSYLLVAGVQEDETL